MQGQRAPRVDRQRVSRLAHRLIQKCSIRRGISLPRMRPRQKTDFVGTEIVGASSGRLRLLRRFDLWRNHGHNGLRHFLLYREDVLQHAVVALGPDVVAGKRVNKLASHTNPIRRLPDAALQHIADAEFAADLPDIGRLALVGE